MRYYNFVLGTSSEQIKKDTKISLRDYDFDSCVGAMNNYMLRNIKNDMTFLAYREEEGDLVFAVFSYDESKNSFAEAYGYILEMLENVFLIKNIKDKPSEITGGQFFDCFIEAKRRRLCGYNYGFIDSSNVNLYDEYYKVNERHMKYNFEEKIASDNCDIKYSLYDDNFVRELNNIKSHKNTEEHKGNMVHYVISSKSIEAASDMAETLIQNLYAAKRLDTKRMIIVSEIDPEIYIGISHLEEIIENNFGGVIVIDLTEKFGHDPVSYSMASKYIEKLVKKYRNDCLFIFTYNIDNPGFSYLLLPELKKYVLPVALKEGWGDRKTAENYMKKLIKQSEYSMYANQAGEYMTLFPGERFSQTDILMAYEQFDAWCVNKNILQAYNYELLDDFMLDRDADEQSSYEKLNNLIGLDIVKRQIDKILNANTIEMERKNRNGSSYKPSSMHMIFSGNPGTAKTTVAKLFANVTKEKGILKSGAFVERSGVELDGLGCVLSIKKAFSAAKGGVLFIDEAYAICSQTAITVLIQEMENRRDEVIVILAGYNERMQEFMELNEGLKSRIPYWIDFPDYDEYELTEIFKMMLEERGFSVTDDAMREAHYIFERVKYAENFGNGRYVRNLIERTTQNQANRLYETRNNVNDLSKEELFLITKEDICNLEEGLKDEKPTGAAIKELEELVGLSSVKSVIKKAIASFKLKKICMDKGIRKDKPSMHMVFTGNPGTAKTTVARLFSEIMRDENVLPTGKFVEAGRADLIGTHVGQTAPKVKKKFKEAQGGVLFIDEAYSLCDDCKGSFGDEAINTIVQEMENHREDTIVVFAGYPNEMQEFLDRNPGLTSRIAFQVSFEDYSVDELCDITRLMLSKKKMSITDEAMSKLRTNYDNASLNSDYGNGRYVRKIIEEAEMNVAQRLFKLDEDMLTNELITTIEECDIPEKGIKKQLKKYPMGFSMT